jgi:hypothetical protein
MLREYDTRPKVVLACLIEETGEIKKVSTGKYKYTHKGKGAVSTCLEFTVSKKPVPGDYIIYLSKDDCYHCTKEVFESKYMPRSSHFI